MTDARRVQLTEQRDRALDDLLELERLEAGGTLDPDTALRLRHGYEADAADALRALDRLDDAPVPTGRSPRRVAAGVTAFVVVAALVTIALVKAVEPRPEGGFVTGGVASDVVTSGTGVDLSTVSNAEMEAVVAQNPDIIPMRLALARRYVEDGDFSSALGHYLYILEREDNPEALMYVGWMTYVSGDAATGVALLERSLQIAPADPLAQWFLANALLYGMEDASGAIPLLQAVIDSGVAPDDVIAAARQMLIEATA
jgi:tetratricopeptide (TPR) repeat protein